MIFSKSKRFLVHTAVDWGKYNLNGSKDLNLKKMAQAKAGTWP